MGEWVAGHNGTVGGEDVGKAFACVTKRLVLIRPWLVIAVH